MTHLGTVITVKDDWHSVVLGHQSDMLSSGNGSQDGCLLSGVLDAFARQEGCSSVGKLENIFNSTLHKITRSNLNDNW